MAKAAKKKAKPRSKTYDPKLKIEGSFEDVIRVSVTPAKKEPIANPKKKS